MLYERLENPTKKDLFNICKSGRSFKRSLAILVIYQLSYRVAGGCRDPRVGTDSVCCNLPGESPRPRLLKIIIMRET